MLARKLGCAVNLPDLNPLFSPAEFSAFKSCIAKILPDGSQGISYFTKAHTFGADLVFPALLALSLTLLIWRTANDLPKFARQSPIIKLCVSTPMPIAYAISDYTENTLIWQWLATNDESAATSHITAATTLKFSFLVIAVMILLLFALARLKHRPSS
ncbi:MAG: hypothetical protein ACRCU5_07885 [Rhizobiaceae bacterium]